MASQDPVENALRDHMELERRARSLRQAIYLARDPGNVDPKMLKELEQIEMALEAARKSRVVVSERKPHAGIPDAAPAGKTKSATRGGGTRTGGKGGGISVTGSKSFDRTVGELAYGRGIDPEALSRAVRTSAAAIKLKADRTGLEARYDVRMSPIPTGVYHLLDPAKNPLVEVVVECTSLASDRLSARVRVQAYLEGVSSNHVKTFELKQGESQNLRLLPTLLPDKTRFITEVQRACLHVIVEDLDGATELHDSVTVTMLARNSGLNAMIDPSTGAITDLTRYYGAWVTPHAEEILILLRSAAEKTEAGTIQGYEQSLAADVTDQARALFETLKNETKIVYVNSVLDFGAGAGYFSQRARLPRESLKQQSANCLDGTLLFASLLEAATLKPAIVIFPGHALVGWQNLNTDGKPTREEILKNWTFLETTWIGARSFDEAVAFGREQVAREFGKPNFKMHKLVDLRLEGIFPME